ncbi:uracil-DNA glycosylase [Brachyspira pulli]|uniref:uracil-DNA glycosylase n=1 Tax=Brachyspira pulli TaxID=310721 RepID=UPI0030047AE9
MNKIEKYFLQQNQIKFSSIVCSSHNKKIILKNPKKLESKKENKDINKMKEIHNEELKKIYSEVEKCMKCEALCNSRLNVVFGRGDEEPDIVFVGEAPGADEDKQGLPFVGRGGKLLDKWIEQLGINNKKYYIMNALKCRPPENRDPLPEEKSNCRDYFVTQLKILNPKIICALGRHGFGNLIDFDLKTPFGKARNKVHYYNNNGKDVPVIATYHPAYILRNQKEEQKVIDDLNFMLSELEKIKNN